MKKNGILPIVQWVVAGMLGLVSSIAMANERVPGEYIVKIKSDSNAKALQSLVKQGAISGLSSEAILGFQTFLSTDQLALVKVNPSVKAETVAKMLSAHGSVELVEPNYIYHLAEDGVPNDAEFANLWAMNNTGQTVGGQAGTLGADLGILPVWARGITGSRAVTVAVIDTGIDYNHPDLVQNIAVNAGEIPADGIDNDGNGFIDDVFGWNAYARNGNPMDGHSHGTHCAGTIGANGNNTLGVAGVNWNVSLLPVKIFSDGGSTTAAAIIEGINYATMRKVQITSNSWGGGGFSQTLFDAIKASGDAGITFVAAAGNNRSNNDRTAFYPATYDLPNIISVAATDNQDKLASFSNYGATKVHVAAPGVNIHSTIPNAKYALKSGTSMAAPHVSGVAALLLSQNPNLTPAELRARLIETSTPIAVLGDKSVSKGRVSVLGAIDAAKP